MRVSKGAFSTPIGSIEQLNSTPCIAIMVNTEHSCWSLAPNNTGSYSINASVLLDKTNTLQVGASFNLYAPILVNQLSELCIATKQHDDIMGLKLKQDSLV